MSLGSISERQDACRAIAPTSRPRFREQVALVPVGEDAVLYDEGSGEMYRLDRVAAKVCRLIDGRTSIEGAVDRLVRTFDAPCETIEADVVSMVRALCGMGLLACLDGRTRPRIQSD
jgi:hypothetical protein